MTAPVLGTCGVCGVMEEPTDLCPKFAWSGRICRACHAAKRLAFPCPCLTLNEALILNDRAGADAAAREALTKVAAILRPSLPNRAPSPPSGKSQPR